MPHYTAKSRFRHADPPALGVLITNLGTPDAPETGALRRYLGEFLADPRVVEAPRWLWRIILHGIILRIRPRQSAQAYRAIWSDEGSPLLVISQRQARGIAQRLQQKLPGPVHVSLGMRYGRPAIRDALRELRERGAERILVLPLYPQYSGATGGSTFDALGEELRQWRRVPDLRLISHYHDDPGYIAALAASIRDYWQQHGRGERLLFSFHGVPKRYLDNGDPYHCECHKTARLTAEALGLEQDQWLVTFQSRFGREPWLQPYTDETVTALGRQGLGRLDVACPGFSADCLETLEEIAIQNAEFFTGAGGGELRYIPALNDRDDHLDALVALIRRHLQGWPEAEPGYDKTTIQHERQAGAERARAMGADSQAAQRTNCNNSCPTNGLN